MEEVAGAVTVRLMKKGDLDQVLLIEQCSFPAPWATEAYLSELITIRMYFPQLISPSKP